MNHHRASIRAFVRWAWKDGRLPDDPLISVGGCNVKEDRRHDRRTLAVDELRRLIQVAHQGKPYRRMSGPARALCYRLAVATGLRYAEIASITPESFRFTKDHPSVTVAAGCTKNGEPATLALPKDVGSDLASYTASLPPKSPVFPLPEKGALADQVGVSPRVVQMMMRHSTLELTGRYTRPRMHDIEGGTSALPSLRPSSTLAEPMLATGTDPRRINDRFAHRRGRIGAERVGI